MTALGASHARTRQTVILAVGFTAYWLVVLPLDTRTDEFQQALLGLLTWGVLGGALWISPAEERVQVLTMVAVATFFECLASLVLGLYRYRLDNLPLYVPPGHGLFYLVSLRVAQVPALAARSRLVVGAVVAGATLLMLRGVADTTHPDLLGLISWLAFLPFVTGGSFPLLFAVSFTMTMALEFYGTALGTWAWAAFMPVIGIPSGNPPACIGAGYCCMDRIARRLAPGVHRLATSFRSLRSSVAPGARRAAAGTGHRPPAGG